nr:type I polyketide synthase [Acanthopleuribacter pedis]
MSQLRSRNIKIWLEGDKLRLKAPKGHMTAELKNQLKDQKEALIAFLGNAAKPPSPTANAAGAAAGAAKSTAAAPQPAKTAENTAPAPPPEPPEPEAPKGEPLTRQQAGLWVIRQVGLETAAHHAVFGVEIRGRVMPELFEMAMAQVADRHACLDNVFPMHNGLPYQTSSTEPEQLFRYRDLTKLPAEERDAACDDLLHTFAHKAFNHENGPLWRAVLVRREDYVCRLLVVLHQMIGDEASAQITALDILRFYNVAVRKLPLEENALEDRYEALKHHQEDFLASSDYTEQHAFWRDYLADRPKVFQMFCDRPRPTVQEYKGASHELAIDAGIAEALTKMAEAKGATLENTLLAAYVALLHRYSGANDFTVGLRRSLSMRGNFEELIAPLAHYLPLRNRLHTINDYQELLDYTQDNVAKIDRNRDIFLEAYPDDFDIDWDFSRHPFFQVMFQYEEPANLPDVVTDCELTSFFFETDNIICDLNLRIENEPQGLRAFFEYDDHLFLDDTIQRMADHYANLLQAVANQPDGHIAKYPILSKTEYRTLISDWNDNTLAIDDTLTIHGMIEAQAAKTPGNIAVSARGRSLTYAQVDERANQIAAYLHGKGIGVGDVVAVNLELSVDLLTTLLGVLKSGAAYMHLNPSFTKQHRDDMLSDSKPNHVITSATHRDQVAGLTSCLYEEISRAVGDVPAAPVKTDTPKSAYVMFTSKSGNRHLGVVKPHKAVCNRLLWLREAFSLDRNDAVLLKSPFAFGISVLEFFWPLSCGARVVLADSDRLGDQHYLADIMQREKVTAVHFAPSQLDSFLLSAQAKRSRYLKRVFCSGEQLGTRLQQRFFKEFPQSDLYNVYSVKEATGPVTFSKCDPKNTRTVSIGKPIANTQIYLLDAFKQPVPIGVPADIYIGGTSMATEFLASGAEHQARFINNPFDDGATLLYETGDVGRFLSDGQIEYLGTRDEHAKVSGMRVDITDIEHCLKSHPDVQNAAVALRRRENERAVLIACLETVRATPPPSEELRTFLRKSLPAYMIPERFTYLEQLPMRSDGQVDREALPISDDFGPGDQREYPRSYSEVERIISRIWREVLNLKEVSLHDNFFEIGGTAMEMVQVFHKLPELLRKNLEPLDLFKFPTIHSLDLHFENQEDEQSFYKFKTDYQKEIGELQDQYRKLPGTNIAVVGMSCRFPGADSPEEFWQNLVEGKETLTFFSKEELIAEGVDPELVEDEDYVRAQGILRDTKGFDTGFFGVTPREAQIMDPQQRIFLECCWETLERAGYCTQKYSKHIGVYGGVGFNHYLAQHLLAHPTLVDTVGIFPIIIANEKDSLCTRASYMLNLTGPAVTVQTACSTPLVSIHLACQALVNRECEMMLAGGVQFGYLQKSGYLYEPGMLLSPDGHCRPFDARAAGIVPSQGVGVVLLKRLDDALKDGDTIYAVIRGSAANNDGANKTNYTAYSTDGQQSAIRRALGTAGVPADTITYVETSSGGSLSGDATELESMTKVYGRHNARHNYCAVGSVKSNIGGADTAGGCAAFIKTVLSLYHQKLVPTINYEKLNPKVDLSETPFYVNTETRTWERTNNTPLRAAISGFGLGGTNTHLILEEGPRPHQTPKTRPWQLLTLSARSSEALDNATQNLSGFLKDNPHINFSDATHTLHVGREDFKHRRMLVCQSLNEAVLEIERKSERVYTNYQEQEGRPIAFMFPGQGAQYTNMGDQLYKVELVFREEVDYCWERFQHKFPKLYESLSEKDRRARTRTIHKTDITQISLFILEYALAKLLRKWGIVPDAMIGNSTGEYVAACLAGVFTLDEALELLVARGEITSRLPPGEMIRVAMPESDMQALIHDNPELSLAAVANPAGCMISGTVGAISDLLKVLKEKKVYTRRLFARHAFHSFMLDEHLADFREKIKGINLKPPQNRIISTITGTWLTQEEATSHSYWARQMRGTVRFARGVEVLLQDPDRILLEVGPDHTLSLEAKQSNALDRGHTILSTMRQPQEQDSDTHYLMTTMGRLWLNGVDVDWEGFQSDTFRHRIVLPTYPFERKPHWIDPPKHRDAAGGDEDLKLEADEMEPDDIPLEEENYRPNVDVPYVPPTTAHERLLAGVWQDLLGLQRVGIHDDFFELGGTSLVAMRMVNQLAKKHNVGLANHIVLQRRTIASLAEKIAESRDGSQPGNEDSPLITIQEGTPKSIPIFMVHPIGGDILFYRDFSHYLGAKQTVYAFQAPSMMGKGDPVNDIKRQAADYVAEMEKITKGSRFIIGGASYGGLVAYEIAQQMHAKSRTPALVILVDTPAPGYMPKKVAGTAEILHYLLGDQLNLALSDLQGLDAEDQLNFINDRARSANNFSALPDNLGLPMLNTWMAHQEGMHAYKPLEYPGRGLFFRPTEAMKLNPLNMHIPWIELMPNGLKLKQLKGNHITMNFGANAKDMAREIRTEINSLRGT